MTESATNNTVKLSRTKTGRCLTHTNSFGGQAVHLNQFRVVWQKYRDPHKHLVEKFRRDEFRAAEYSQDDDEHEPFTLSQPVITGPMGVIPLDEENLLSSHFNFWMGHTNFPITSTVKSIIEDTDGVEAIDVYTPYRIRIAVGKAFDDRQVRRTIQENLFPPENAQLMPAIGCQALANSLACAYPYWAILQCADDRIDILGGESIDVVQKQIGERPVLVASWDADE